MFATAKMAANRITSTGTPTVHINPKFKSAHINPNFINKKPLETNASTQIHINPKFYNDYLHRPPPQPHPETTFQSIPSTSSSHHVTSTTNRFSINRLPSVKAPSASRIISNTNKKIVRQPLHPPKTFVNTSMVCMPSRHNTTIDKNLLLRNHSKSLVRQGVILKSSSTRYDLPTVQAVRSKYSIDYRNIRTPTPSSQANRINDSLSSTQVIRNNYKLRRIGYSPLRTGRAAPNKWPTNTSPLSKQLKLVSINGIFYKSSGSKLQRQTAVSPTKNAISLRSRTTSSQLSPSKNLLGPKLRVRGALFLVEANGKKLRRIHEHNRPASEVSTALTATPSMSRIELGRMTFIATENNTFVRTDRHKTRAHLSVAKKHSIQVLRRNLVKSNVPCPIFRKVGKCQAHDRGRCNRLHDPKQVAICPKFLSGCCTLDACLMSHAVSLAKMPVCRFFLKAMCSKNDCPYLHKKVNETTEICPDFVKGYCERAEKCSKRHEFLCPDFESKGKCEKTRCPHVHRQKTTTRIRKQSIAVSLRLVSRQEDLKSADAEPSDVASRYFGSEKRDLKSTIASAQQTDKVIVCAEPLMDTALVESINDEQMTLIPQRPKLGALPSYIPID